MSRTLVFCLALLVPASAGAGGAPAMPAAVRSTAAAAPARAAFERLGELAGRWRGRSTEGWTESIELRRIAGDSVLLETSQFTDDPEGRNAMATAYQMDGESLVLTHYCEAGNAPRLRATAFDDGGGTITFTFDGGTNLASRDVGHMDSMVLRFGDARHFRSRWTWYQAGKERWLEDIEYERVE